LKAWDLDEIRRAVKGKWLMRGPGENAGGRRFNGHVCTDSRQAAAGDLFFAIKGARFDAHRFVKDVVERDAACIIVHKTQSEHVLARAKARDVAIVLVDDTIAALNRLAAAYRAGEFSGGLRAKVIAVGGSNGKTTTKRIIHALLEEKYGPDAGHASPKSFNNNIGMPLTLLGVRAYA
jgi:UDP-N-acetylmuramyl pentapeptide synthase